MFLRRYSSLLLRPWSRRLSGLCCPLAEQRSLLRLRGPNTATFLQGLITNDAQRLREGAVYSHLLNVQGRSLFDVILYRFPSEQAELNDVLLECDVSAVEPIQAHLKVYNLRKKIDIQPCPELSVWAVISSQKSQDPPARKLPAPALLCGPDPRVAVMGWRLVAQSGEDVAEIVPDAQMGSYKDYCRHRYEHGVPEGASDIQPGVALPLESNLVYMNGISFSKGCYLGQELTARTHHTGVIRKRLTPVRLSSPLPREIQGPEIVTAAGKAAGKYKAGIEDLGLALLRLAHINEELLIKVDSQGPVSVTASAPEWWPKTSDS
ncbi:putative transferase CAF17, mitochondrial [Spea bombifrons]|uniref:putative transferase CAF17, mitochondrial n=1 Tax=Spea bombifrons TaxID=233779 RepID=UPI00234A0A43|nr:putative transferase CAF17, mitochondrial [Spea bombifrons]